MTTKRQCLFCGQEGKPISGIAYLLLNPLISDIPNERKTSAYGSNLLDPTIQFKLYRWLRLKSIYKLRFLIDFPRSPKIINFFKITLNIYLGNRSTYSTNQTNSSKSKKTSFNQLKFLINSLILTRNQWNKYLLDILL